MVSDYQVVTGKGLNRISRNNMSKIVFEMGNRPWPWTSTAWQNHDGATLSRQSKYQMKWLSQAKHLTPLTYAWPAYMTTWLTPTD
jgi:hypothetical protein